MKEIVILTLTFLLISISAKSQSLFFIDGNSYLCTESVILKPNSDRGKDLNLYFLKDERGGLIAMTTNVNAGAEFEEKVIIYLEDGNVVSISESSVSEYVDNSTKAVYRLSSDQIKDLRASNIHTIRFTLGSPFDENRSVSNNGIETKTIVTEFYNN